MTHCKIETRQRVSDSSTSPQLIWSFPKDSEWLRNSRNVSSRHERDVKTHREAEVFTRASSRVVSPRVDKTPPAGVLERFEKRSVVATRPAIERALRPSSAKVGERRRVPSDTIVKMQSEAKDNGYVPSCMEARMLPSSTSVNPLVPPTFAMAPRQSLNGPMPPAEAISRQQEQNIISKASGESNVRS